MFLFKTGDKTKRRISHRFTPPKANFSGAVSMNRNSVRSILLKENPKN